MAVREHTRNPLRRCRAIRHKVAFTCGAICLVSVASAKDEPADVSHSRAEIEIGARILPGVRSTRRTETTFGDLDFITGIQMIFQASKLFGVVAGFSFAPFPLAETQLVGPSEVPRSHTRSTLTFSLGGRGTLYSNKSVNVWAAFAFGVVAIADRFEPAAVSSVPSILGTREVSLSTEAPTLGLEFGASYTVYQPWVLSARLRGSQWFLPGVPACVPSGDCATLSGGATAVEVGVSFGYMFSL